MAYNLHVCLSDYYIHFKSYIQNPKSDYGFLKGIKIIQFYKKRRKPNGGLLAMIKNFNI